MLLQSQEEETAENKVVEFDNVVEFNKTLSLVAEFHNVVEFYNFPNCND